MEVDTIEDGKMVLLSVQENLIEREKLFCLDHHTGDDYPFHVSYEPFQYQNLSCRYDISMNQAEVQNEMEQDTWYS